MTGIVVHEFGDGRGLATVTITTVMMVVVT